MFTSFLSTQSVFGIRFRLNQNKEPKRESTCCPGAICLQNPIFRSPFFRSPFFRFAGFRHPGCGTSCDRKPYDRKPYSFGQHLPE